MKTATTARKRGGSRVTAVDGNGNFPGVIKFDLRHDPVPAVECFSPLGLLRPREGRVLQAVAELDDHFRPTAVRISTNRAGMTILSRVAPRLAARATLDVSLVYVAEDATTA